MNHLSPDKTNKNIKVYGMTLKSKKGVAHNEWVLVVHPIIDNCSKTFAESHINLGRKTDQTMYPRISLAATVSPDKKMKYLVYVQEHPLRGYGDIFSLSPYDAFVSKYGTPATLKRLLKPSINKLKQLKGKKDPPLSLLIIHDKKYAIKLKGY